MRSRCSTSRSIRTPPSDDNKPPSNVATTDLPETGDRPGNGSVELIMADVVSQKWCGFESITESYAPSKACATFGSLLQIMLQIIMGKVSWNVCHRVLLPRIAGKYLVQCAVGLGFFSIRNPHIRIAKHKSLPRTSFSGGT